jgi:hypothetical protein
MRRGETTRATPEAAMPSSNECLRVVLRELARHGIRPDHVERTGSGHLRVHWSAAAGPQHLVVAFSPSDWRGARQARAEVRRKLRSANAHD